MRHPWPSSPFRLTTTTTFPNRRRSRHPSKKGRAHIKTGTLDGVKAAAGYALDAQGRRYAITFLINHPRAQAGAAAIDALLVWVAQRRIGEKNIVLESE